MKMTKMNNNKLPLFKKSILIIGAVAIGFVIGWSVKSVLLKNNLAPVRNEILHIEYGDVLPIDEADYMNHSTKNQNYDYKVYLLIDPYCDSCVSKVDVANRLAEILGDFPIGIYILWKQQPSEEKVKAVNISEENQVVFNDKEIINEYPSYFIADSLEKIIMITDDEEKLVKKLKEIEGETELRDRANSYLLNLKSVQKKKRLIYFAMDGCPDCERVMSNSKVVDVLNKYDLITVYTSNSYGEQEFVDIGNIFRNIFDISWYPSFLIIDEDGSTHFIGEEPDDNVIEDLEKLAK